MFRETVHASWEEDGPCARFPGSGRAVCSLPGERTGRVLASWQLKGQQVSGGCEEAERCLEGLPWPLSESLLGVAQPVPCLGRGVFKKQERLSITRQRWSCPSKCLKRVKPMEKTRLMLPLRRRFSSLPCARQVGAQAYAVLKALPSGC